jgi:hypothetical protein
VLMVDPRMGGLGQVLHPVPDELRGPPGGPAPAVPVDQRLGTIPPVGAPEAPHLPGGQPQELRHLRRCQSPAFRALRTIARCCSRCAKVTIPPSSASLGADIFTETLGRTKSLNIHTRRVVFLTALFPVAKMRVNRS